MDDRSFRRSGFRLGDVVSPKDRVGFDMTVCGLKKVGDGFVVFCRWFSGSKLYEGEFPADRLVRKVLP